MVVRWLYHVCAMVEPRLCLGCALVVPWLCLLPPLHSLHSPGRAPACPWPADQGGRVTELRSNHSCCLPSLVPADHLALHVAPLLQSVHQASAITSVVLQEL